jgi:hypothetical protein
VVHHLRAFLFLQSDFTPGGRIRLVIFTNYTNEICNSLLRKSYTTQHNSRPVRLRVVAINLAVAREGLAAFALFAVSNILRRLSDVRAHRVSATKTARALQAKVEGR